MSIAVYETERFENMERVADLKMHGYSDTQIAKELDIKRKDVIALFDEYKDVLVNDSEARDLARDKLYQLDKHYDRLIRKTYDLLDDLETLQWHHQVAAQKNGAIKLIAELEAKRLDALQKAGLLDSAELGDELADMEEKQAILISILREDLCEDCKMNVAHKLSKVTNSVEVVASEIIDVPVIDEEEQTRARAKVVGDIFDV